MLLSNLWFIDIVVQMSLFKDQSLLMIHYITVNNYIFSDSAAYHKGEWDGSKGRIFIILI